MLNMFVGLITWIFRPLIVKFVILVATFAVMEILVPFLIDLISPFLNASALSGAFSGLDAGVWWFVDFFALDVGIPLLLAAWVTRFLIRRIPFIG